MPRLRVLAGDRLHELEVPAGTRLRRALLDAGLSPYAPATRRLNCGGNGICATCGVWVTPAPAPVHWHDRAAARFGYPRLSCQIRVEEDLEVELLADKRVWDARDPERARAATEG
ncbi:MAG: 2Fe-2S iron-sulfur cluster-binding protein [Myxococcota bacterium]